MASSSSSSPGSKEYLEYLDGCSVLCLGCPPSMQFGIDFSCWATGPKFMGVNRIPPGSHFIYYSAGTGDYADRTGFWVYLKPQQVIVRKWDVETELLVMLPEAEELRYIDGVAHFDFEHNLGPYPFEHHNNWLELVRHVTPETIARVEPILKHVTMKSQEYNPETTNQDCCARKSISSTKEYRPKPVDGLEPFSAESNILFFTPLPDLHCKVRKRLQGAELSKLHLDKSDALESLLKIRTWREVLGELEMAYIVFVLGQNFDGFEYWKELMLLLSCCSRAVEQHEELYADFIRILFCHLQQAPDDFFQDDLSAGNFLTRALGDLLEIACDATSKVIRDRASHLAALVQKRFGCDWRDLDEDAPVIVESDEHDFREVLTTIAS
eukprot:GEMP01046042.1.p1 GENE.GEMP01046042.1~~GEMP01046042.1.p1  ORF type:complete len:382 (+),score=70.91 GEMP01046042.1:118-1263(+)